VLESVRGSVAVGNPSAFGNVPGGRLSNIPGFAPAPLQTNQIADHSNSTIFQYAANINPEDVHIPPGFEPGFAPGFPPGMLPPVPMQFGETESGEQVRFFDLTNLPKEVREQSYLGGGDGNHGSRRAKKRSSSVMVGRVSNVGIGNSGGMFGRVSVREAQPQNVVTVQNLGVGGKIESRRQSSVTKNESRRASSVGESANAKRRKIKLGKEPVGVPATTTSADTTTTTKPTRRDSVRRNSTKREQNVIERRLSSVKQKKEDGNVIASTEKKTASSSDKKTSSSSSSKESSKDSSKESSKASTKSSKNSGKRELPPQFSQSLSLGRSLSGNNLGTGSNSLGAGTIKLKVGSQNHVQIFGPKYTMISVSRSYVFPHITSHFIFSPVCDRLRY
jgi:hypothetical protein